MKNIRKVSVAAIMLLFAAGCSKEGKMSTDSEELKIVPAPCNLPMIVDDNGITRVMAPAEATPEEEAAAMATKSDERKYTIPVVFHIFGSDQGSGPLNYERILDVLKWINNDFNRIINEGDGWTYESIPEERKEYVGNLNVEFVLGKYFTDSSPLVGGEKINGGKIIHDDASIVLYGSAHPVAAKGPANYSTGGEIRKIAWDNNMYMNVYICGAIFGNGDRGQSGVAYYPDEGMTRQNTARVTYNGWFLPGGTYYNKDFTSIITHEFGHFFNLGHTFGYSGDNTSCGSYGEDGGSIYGDRVLDTPETEFCQANYAYYGMDKKNCHGEMIDHGNFMNYGVYCHFTQGQVARMQTALEMNARKGLWDEENHKVVLEGKVRHPGESPGSSTMSERLDYIDKAIRSELE